MNTSTIKKSTAIISIILCFSMIHLSCKTTKSTSCTMFVQNSLTTPVLPESEMAVIKSLFESNRIDYANYQFYRLDTDELGFYHVRCYQFVNNLKVFSEELIFHFNQQRTFYLVSGNKINAIGLDAKPSLHPNKVAEQFIRMISQEKDEIVDEATRKGCFEIEFGYIGLDDSSKHFTKAWKVKPTGKDYPFAYINDNNSEIIHYDTGIRR